MIVRSLLATDLLRYSRLELSRLPERGLILITGPNESGKSSVAEIICLALFGRTFALGPEAMDKAIRWETRTGAVELQFATSSGIHRLGRELDLDGGRSAALLRADGTEVRGWDRVTEAVQDLVGFGFPEFLESFYLARREAVPPKPRSDVLRAMAGVPPLERLAEELDDRIPRQRRRCQDIEAEIAEVDSQLARFRRDDLLPPRPGPKSSDAELVVEVTDRKAALAEVASQLAARTPALESATRALVGGAGTARMTDLAQLADKMEEALDSVEESVAFLGYDDATPGTDRLSSMLSRVQEGLKDYGVLVEAAKVQKRRLAGLLGEPGGEPAPQTFADEEAALDNSRKLAREARKRFGTLAGCALGLAVTAIAIGLLPGLGLPHAAAICALIGGGVLGVLTGLLFTRQREATRQLARVGQMDAELSQRREDAETDLSLLGALADRPMAASVAGLEKLHGEEMKAAIERFRQSAGGRLIRSEVGERLGAGAEEQLSAVREHIEKLRARIGADVKALGHIQDLRGTRAGLSATHGEEAERLATQELSRELLGGAIRQITFDFFARVRQGLARVLPQLSEGRYQYLRIDDDLSVRVFSSEKQDFVTWEEISGGTQRQVALATRVALSETIVERVERGPQFLFLDEPFAFFDARRTRAALAALPRLGGALPQVWIATQEQPPGFTPDVVVRCSHEGRRLAVP